jgi:hypothetical protein
MNAVAQFWLWFYFACGIATLIFMLVSYEFLEDTPWWRKILGVIAVVALWPVILVLVMAVG